MSLSPHKKIQGNSVVNCTEIKFHSFSRHKVKPNFLHSLFYFPSVVFSVCFFLKCSSSHSVNLQLNKYLFIFNKYCTILIMDKQERCFKYFAIYSEGLRWGGKNEFFLYFPKNKIWLDNWVMGSLASAFFFFPHWRNIIILLHIFILIFSAFPWV